MKWGQHYRALFLLSLNCWFSTPYKYQRDRKTPCRPFQSPSVPRRNCLRKCEYCSLLFLLFYISPRWDYVTMSPYRLKPLNICLDSETNYVSLSYFWFIDFWFIDFFLWLKRKSDILVLAMEDMELCRPYFWLVGSAIEIGSPSILSYVALTFTSKYLFGKRDKE